MLITTTRSQSAAIRFASLYDARRREAQATAWSTVSSTSTRSSGSGTRLAGTANHGGSPPSHTSHPSRSFVHPPMVALVRRWVGADRLAIVTDAMAALGMPPGAYRLAGRDCIVDESSARLPGGGLAGSVIGLDTGVANLAKFAGITAEEAALAATVVPARLLGLKAMPMLPAGAPGATAAPAGPAAPR